MISLTKNEHNSGYVKGTMIFFLNDVGITNPYSVSLFLNLFVVWKTEFNFLALIYTTQLQDQNAATTAAQLKK